MAIKHFKASDHSPESQSAIKIAEHLTISSLDRKVQSDVGEHRLLPGVFVAEKGQPTAFKALGPSVLYIIEGEYQIEDQSAPGKPILLSKGDVALVDEGTTTKSCTPSKVKAFGVTYIPAPSVITDVFTLYCQ